MPSSLPPLPASNTLRVFYDYVTTGETDAAVEHTFVVRGPAGGDVADVHQGVTDLLTALTPGLFYSGWKLLRARVAVAGSDVTLPSVLPPGLFTFVGSGGGGESRETAPVQYTFSGRSTVSGRKARLSLYGFRINRAGTQFRFEADGGTYAWISAAVAAMQGAANAFCAIDGVKAIWYPYVNWQYNSHWETAVRKG